MRDTAPVNVYDLRNLAIALLEDAYLNPYQYSLLTDVLNIAGQSDIVDAMKFSHGRAYITKEVAQALYDKTPDDRRR